MPYYRVIGYFSGEDEMVVEAKSKKDAEEKAYWQLEAQLIKTEAERITKKEYEDLS